LNKLVFIFEGINTGFTKEIEEIRDNLNINRIYDLYNTIQTKIPSNESIHRSTLKFCPAPWVFLCYFQYLLDTQKLFPEKLEVRVTLNEHDGYTAKLANEING